MTKIKSIKTNVNPSTLRPRVSRHGRLLTDVFRVTIPEVSRVETKLNKKTGEIETKRKVVSPAVERAMTDAEMAVARTHPRAMGPTQNYGNKNTGGNAAGKKKVKAAA